MAKQSSKLIFHFQTDQKLNNSSAIKIPYIFGWFVTSLCQGVGEGSLVELGMRFAVPLDVILYKLDAAYHLVANFIGHCKGHVSVMFHLCFTNIYLLKCLNELVLWRFEISVNRSSSALKSSDASSNSSTELSESISITLLLLLLLELPADAPNGWLLWLREAFRVIRL